MSWFTLAKVLLSVINRVLKHVNDRQLLKAGEQQQIAKQYAQIAKDNGIEAEVVAEIMALPIDEIRKRMDERGDFRD